MENSVVSLPSVYFPNTRGSYGDRQAPTPDVAASRLVLPPAGGRSTAAFVFPGLARASASERMFTFLRFVPLGKLMTLIAHLPASENGVEPGNVEAEPAGDRRG